MLEPNSTHPAKPATGAIARNTNLADAQNPDRQNANIPEINPSSLNSANYNNMPAQNGANMISLSERQFSELLGTIQNRQETPRVTTFSSCTVRFNGGKNVSKVEDFIATIVVFKEAENITDFYALTSFPLLLEGYASSWWQGVKNEARTFEDAIELLRSAFSPPKPDWKIFGEIFQDKQKPTESTDAFICRKRSLFAQLKDKVEEKTIINMIFAQLLMNIRDKMVKDNINTFQNLLYKAREIEISLEESKENYLKHVALFAGKRTIQQMYAI